MRSSESKKHLYLIDNVKEFTKENIQILQFLTFYPC